MTNTTLNTPQAVKLFETQFGSVRAVVIGPRIGFQWRTLKYYRLQPSTTDAAKWVEISANWRASDNRNLAKCVAAVQRFLDAEAPTA